MTKKPEKKHVHKCKSCTKEFATCKPGEIVFGIDLDPEATGEHADVVVECEGYVNDQT